MKNLKVCSLFSGIGGIEKGVEKGLRSKGYEMQVIEAAEKDKKTNECYELIHKLKPKTDVKEVDENSIEDFDLLLAGFPCQPLSISGARRGFADERGQLFFDIIRILEKKKPQTIILENVKGLMNHDKGQTINTVFEELSKQGYGLDFHIMDTSQYGIPQNRERVYIIGRYQKEENEWKEIMGKAEYVKTKKKLNENKKIKKINIEKPKEKEIRNIIENFLEKEVEEEYFLEKEMQRKIKEKIKEKKLNDQTKTIRIDDKRGGNSIHSWELAHKGEVPIIVQEKLNKMVLERRKGASDGNAIRPEKVGATVEEFEKLVEQGYLKHKEDGYDFKFGALSYEVSKIIPMNGVSPTITCTDVVKYALNTPQGIRKMTPLEAMRLQGFEDKDYNILKENGITSKQIYKMMGNAVSVNVVEELTKAIY